jgi:haloalkane dehalogenase
MLRQDSPSLKRRAGGPGQDPAAGYAKEYPFLSRFLTWNGLRYHFIDEGPTARPTPSLGNVQTAESRPPAGETLLFVHGNPTWSFAWRNLIRELSGEHRCVAVDHIGCGLSEKPQDYPYRLAQHIENLCRAIKELDLRGVTLVAHDWGGAIGMGAAGRLPERFARFVLMNTAAFRGRRIPWRIRVCRTPLVGPFAVRGLNLFARAALWMAVERRERITAAVRAGYLAPYDNWRNRVAIQRFVEDIPLSPRHPSYAALVAVEESLAEFVRAPLLLVWGERDWCFTPEFLAEFQRRFPRAETLALADAGHYVFEDAWERIVPRMREFLVAHPI